MFSVIPAFTGPLGVGWGPDVACVGLEETDWLVTIIGTVPTDPTVSDAPNVPTVPVVVAFGDAGFPDCGLAATPIVLTIISEIAASRNTAVVPITFLF